MLQDIRAAFRLSIRALALAATASFAPAAAASKTYPDAVQKALNMPCAPPCTLCHDTLEGGLGTANRPFGKTVRATGELGCCSPGSVADALTKVETTCAGAQGGCNSDGDDLLDIAELKEGSDPNEAGPGNLCGGPTYGCGARLAGGSAEFDWVSLLAAGAAALALIHGARRMKKRA